MKHCRKLLNTTHFNHTTNKEIRRTIPSLQLDMLPTLSNNAFPSQLAELWWSCFQTSVPKLVKTSDAFAQVTNAFLSKNTPEDVFKEVQSFFIDDQCGYIQVRKA